MSVERGLWRFCANIGAVLTALGLLLTAHGAAAQQPLPPEHYTLDPRGVDMVSGSFNFGTTDVVIGQPGAGGLIHARQYLEGWRDVEVGGWTQVGTDIIVSTGLVSATFVPDGAGYKPKVDDGSTYELKPDGSVWITDRYGSIAVFEGPEWQGVSSLTSPDR